MQLLKGVFILVIAQAVLNCNPKKNSSQMELEISTVTSVESVDDVPGPPPDFKSDFNTLEEWLFDICDRDKPAIPIATYSFGVLESQDEYIIYLVGLNKYTKGNESTVVIEFEPTNMYFRMPESQYRNLGRQQVINKIKSQLEDFIKTEKFNRSFFAQEKSGSIEFKGETINKVTWVCAR